MSSAQASSEEQLMEIFRGCGFDFTSTTREIAVRFPRVLDWGVQPYEVLPFQLTRAFAGFGPLWKIPVNRDVEWNLPPTRYVHEFYPTKDVRENFERALQQLTASFGSGCSSVATNVYERNWRIGFFTIRVISWPRELNRESHNVFEGRNPYLGIAANIYIAPDFPFVEPTEDATQPMRELLVASEECKVVCDSQVYARRNRVAAAKDTLAVGLDADALLIRAEDRTVRVPLGQIEKFVLTRLTPSRFAGSCSLSLSAVFLGRHQVRVTVASGREAGSLDHSSNELARAIGKPLAIEEYPDDG
jgi:hypothetical protein